MSETDEIDVECGRCNGSGKAEKKVITFIRCPQCHGTGHHLVKKTVFPNTTTEEDDGRKIELPDYCHPLTGRSRGGDEDCDHDYPPESRKSGDEWNSWTCSKCGMTRSYEVFD